MAFDWTKVPGYTEGMSPEERIALLEGYDPQLNEPPDPLPSPNEPTSDPPYKPGKGKVVSKDVFDKTASELAAVKRQLRQGLSEAERQAAEMADTLAAREAELLALRRESALGKYATQAAQLGFAGNDITTFAEALTDGDHDAIFAHIQSLLTAREKKLRADILKDTPRPPTGTDPNGLPQDAEAFRKLPLNRQAELLVLDPSKYGKFLA
jgi:hypothetical protein